MSEPVRLYAADGTQFDCVAPSEVARLLAAGDWRREPWPEPAKPKPQVQPRDAQPDDEEIPFATPLPKRKAGRPRKQGGGVL